MDQILSQVRKLHDVLQADVTAVDAGGFARLTAGIEQAGAGA